MPWFAEIAMTEVTPTLYLGNYYNAAELVKNGNPLGIQAILNVCREPEYTVPEGVAHIQVPFHDGHPIPEQDFKTCMDFLQEHHGSGKKTLIHCAAGISRSPTITASWLHTTGAMDFNTALLHLSNRRPIVGPAVSVVNSARRHLKIWPYDGSMNVSAGSLASMQTSYNEETANRLVRTALMQHPNPACPARQAIIRSTNLGIEAHEFACSCANYETRK